MTEATTTLTALHPFEQAGLGRAPFRFIGAENKVGPITWVENGITLQAGAPGQPMGTCEFCGQGIAMCCKIADADGKTFIVGSTCVDKTENKGSRLRTAADKAVRDLQREAKATKDAARVEAARKALENQDLRAALEGRDSPNAYRASKGDTLLDWATWMLEHAGTTGRLDAARTIEAAAKKI